MELSPYLDAIQQVTGQTYGEKLQSLHQIAKKIIEDCEASNRPIEVHSSEELPEILIPLVQLKIAEILKEPEGILDALKSDEPMVFASALKIKWFFNGSVENHPNAHYFQHHVFPYISSRNRFKIIKALAANLTLDRSKISEEFYSIVTEMYNKLEAQPLLMDCSESFIDNIINHHVIKFDVDEFHILLQNHYHIALKYLKLCASAANSPAKNMYPPLETFQEFLSYLMKHNTKNFIELIEMYENSPPKIQLGRKSIRKFLENGIETLIEKTHLFLPILSLDEVTNKLTKSQFHMVFRNMFPKKIEEFNFNNIYDYLEYIPQDQKLPLMLSTFEEVYKVSLLDCNNKITPEVLNLLPSSERINQARKKLETDKNWYTVGDKIENSWVCYLPVEESIPIIKKQILKTPYDYKRIELVNQMIYTCKVNEDTNTLLDVLKYATTQHKNEGSSLLDFLKRLQVDFKLPYLPREHWEVLNEFIDFCHDKRKICINEKEFQDIVISGIHYELLNNLSINKKLDLVSKGNINGRLTRWNLFKKIPKFEKLCIEQFMESIPRVYLETHDNCTWSWPEVVHSFIEAIYDFNKRNSKSKVGSVWIKSNPLFSDEVQKLVSGQIQNDKYFPKIKQMKQLLKINEPDLYSLWVEEYKQLGIAVSEPLIQIENNYQNTLDNWEQYYEYCKNNIDRKSVQQFIHSSCWYQDLPIKFLERSLKNIVDDKDNDAVKVLALLVEGPIFEEFILSQTSNFTDFDTRNSTEKRLSKLAIADALKSIYSPPSIDFIIKLCEGNDHEIVRKCLMNVGRRISADKLIPFCQTLISRSSSAISKLSISLIHDVATTQQLQHILMDLWRTREHRFIHLSLITNILNTFINRPCTETWEMVEECFTSLTVKDQRVLNYISPFDRTPNEYIADYVKLLLTVFKRIGDDVNSLGPEGVWFNTNNLLKNIPNDTADLFPEELHEEILMTYLADLSLPKDVLFAAQRYLVDCYILPAKDKFDSRLKFFLDLFVDILQNHQEIYDPDDFTFSYPVHDFLQGLISNAILIPYSPVKTKLIYAILHAFLSVLKPEEAPEFYCKLMFASVHDDETSPKEFGRKISEITTGLIDSSSVSIFIASKSVYDIFYYFYLNTEAEGQLDLVESLLESNHDNNTLLAANLLLWQHCEMKNSSRFWKIVQFLRKHENIAVVSCANLILSGFKY